jgi:DNA-binding Lrp family transcriptional regulator
MDLDRYDRAILRLLQQDARITNTSLAEKVSLSESACLRRVRALKNRAWCRATPPSSTSRRRVIRSTSS